jgi:hypothetical protein
MRAPIFPSKQLIAPIPDISPKEFGPRLPLLIQYLTILTSSLYGRGPVGALISYGFGKNVILIPLYSPWPFSSGDSGHRRSQTVCFTSEKTSAGNRPDMGKMPYSDDENDEGRRREKDDAPDGGDEGPGRISRHVNRRRRLGAVVADGICRARGGDFFHERGLLGV